MLLNRIRRKKKILIIVENLPVPLDRRVWQEATSLRKKGYDISIICPKGKGYEKGYEVIDGIHIYRHFLPLEVKASLGYCFEYLTALFWEFFLSLKVYFRHGFDVIHACNPPDLICLVGLFFKVFFGRRFIFDHHDINPELYLAKGKRKDLFYILLLFFEKLTFKLADVSIATNVSYKKIAVDRGKMSPEKVFIVRSAPKLEYFKSISPNNSLKNNKKYLVGYVGVMGKQDGVDYLLRSINYIIHTKGRKDIYFVLIGRGSEWESIKKYCSDLKLDDFVNFTGRIPDECMIEYLATCDVCVNPDIVNEFNSKSTMNKILEYMSLGKPVVQFDMIEGRYSAGEASLYAEPNDKVDFAEKILELLDNYKKRKKMGDYGRKRIEGKLQWKFSEKELFKVYQSLFGLDC